MTSTSQHVSPWSTSDEAPGAERRPQAGVQSRASALYKFPRGSFHTKSADNPTRLSAEIAHKLETIDTDQTLTPDQFFDLVDEDGNGNISRDEFVHFHSKLKMTMRLEHDKEESLERQGKEELRADRAQRRNRALCMILAVLAAFSAVLLAANSALTFTMIDIAKETVRGTGMMQVKGSTDIAKASEAR